MTNLFLDISMGHKGEDDIMVIEWVLMYAVQGFIESSQDPLIHIKDLTIRPIRVPQHRTMMSNVGVDGLVLGNFHGEAIKTVSLRGGEDE
jgi:hypothetical protein